MALKDNQYLKIALGQVFTSELVANYMISMFSFDSQAFILDPCFGSGAFIKAAVNSNFYNVSGYEIDKNLFNQVKKDFPSLILTNDDFLLSKILRKYDGIIMNPPYIRHEKINDLKDFGISKERLREIELFSSLPKNANLYMYFIIKAINSLKKNGELIVIFPSSWLRAKSGERFKEYINDNCTVVNEIHIRGNIFERNALVEVLILKLISNKCKCDKKIEFLEVNNGTIIKNPFAKTLYNFGMSYSFSNIGNIRRGLTTGYNRMFINPQFHNIESLKALVPIISTPKAIIGYSTTNAQLDNLLLVKKSNIYTKEIYKYLDKFRNKIIKTKTPKTLFNKIQKGQNWFSLKEIDSNGIIFSYIVRKDMKFILNESKQIVRDNFYIIYPKIEKFLLFALLNNYYTYFQLELLGKKYGAGLLKIQKYDIEQILFPEISNFSDNDRSQLVIKAKILATQGNKLHIEDITKLLSKYTNIPYHKIMKAYNHVLKHRLGVDHEKPYY